jgi:hypothetical protein
MFCVPSSTSDPFQKGFHTLSIIGSSQATRVLDSMMGRVAPSSEHSEAVISIQTTSTHGLFSPLYRERLQWRLWSLAAVIFLWYSWLSPSFALSPKRVRCRLAWTF